MDDQRDPRRHPVPLFVYVTTHRHSRVVGGAFAEGANARILPALEGRLRPDGAAAAFYGRLRGCNNLLRAAVAGGVDWYYIDRGYIGATQGDDYSGQFRVTKNALQSDGRGSPNYERAERLRVTLKDWRQNGEHILLCPPGIVFGELSGFNSAEWTKAAITTLRLSTDRPIRVREKPRVGEKRNAPLREDLGKCWALVTHSSNAAVEALICGVPVFATDRCGSSRCASDDLRKIETPYFPEDRAEWIAVLAAQQWTLAEMRGGICWQELITCQAP